MQGIIFSLRWSVEEEEEERADDDERGITTSKVWMTATTAVSRESGYENFGGFDAEEQKNNGKCCSGICILETVKYVLPRSDDGLEFFVNERYESVEN